MKPGIPLLICAALLLIVRNAPAVAKQRVFVLTDITMHIILAVTDTGAPPLTRYRRVIVTGVR